MALSSAALILIFILSLSTPLSALCIPSHYTFPALKSICVEYACSMWSLFSRAEPVLITPRNLFLLVNFIILCLFVSLHLQQHAPAAGKRSSRKKKRITNDYQAAPQRASLAHDVTPSAAAVALAKEALYSSVGSAELHEGAESSIAGEEDAMQESCMKERTSADGGSLAREIPTVDSDHINGSDVEQIVLDEDGQLRLIGEPKPAAVAGDTKGSDAESKETGRPRSTKPGNGSDAGKIVLDEDGQLRLIQSTNGSDADKIVLDEDGRLRLMDRPQIPFRSWPQKSLSTGDDRHYNKVDNQNDIIDNANYDNPSLNYDIHSVINDTQCLNNNNNDDNSLDNQSLNHNNDTSDPIKSSPLRRTSSRPIRVKKADSLDATWKAINKSKGSAAHRDHKHLIRQSSRQDFKPPNGRGGHGLMRNTNNNSKVRREPSISQEELNAKVESFIAKFNEQIRIQRQQSILSYMQMVDRGA